MPNPRKFIYSASAVAVAAKFDGPHALNRAWATVALPMIGGSDISTEKGPNGNPVLSFASATASVKGSENSGVFTTINTVTVEGLNILSGWLEADLELTLRFDYADGNPAVLGAVVSNQPFTRLVVGGQDFGNVTLDNEPVKQAAKDHDKFRNDLKQGTILKDKHHINKSKKNKKELKAHASIAVDPARLKFDPATGEYGYVGAPERRVYIGEWAEDEDWQGIVGLRIVFESTNPQAKGEIVIADWLGDNGQFYP
ncbi:MAG TPA: hypothetical protein VLE22_07400 [Bryobacteraceae bacterium]|nr:hypothetical protein [Bryobacteraceae bacterium]